MTSFAEKVAAGRQANIDARASDQRAKRSTASNRLQRGARFTGVIWSANWRHLHNDNNRHAVILIKGRPRMLLTASYRAAKDALQQHIRRAMRDQELTAAPVDLHAKLWFPDARKRDATNYGKLIQDAMTGIVYRDDDQIVRATYERAGIDRENPRCEITVTPREAASYLPHEGT